MIKIAYKVVEIFREGDKESWNSVGSVPSAIVNYNQRGWITPKERCNQFLFVFDTFKNAKSFQERLGIGHKIIRVLADIIGNEVIDKYGVELSANSYPSGTVFASRVKVIRSSRTVYKVVNKEGSSATSSGRLGYRKVDYALNNVSMPTQHPTVRPFLFVFDNLEDAISFRLQHCLSFGHFIFKAMAYNCSRVRSCKVNGFDIIVDAKEYPKGTIFADAVLPIEKLSN